MLPGPQSSGKYHSLYRVGNFGRTRGVDASSNDFTGNLRRWIFPWEHQTHSAISSRRPRDLERVFTVTTAIKRPPPISLTIAFTSITWKLVFLATSDNTLGFGGNPNRTIRERLSPSGTSTRARSRHGSHNKPRDASSSCRCVPRSVLSASKAASPPRSPRPTPAIPPRGRAGGCYEIDFALQSKRPKNRFHAEKAGGDIGLPSGQLCVFAPLRESLFQKGLERFRFNLTHLGGLSGRS